MDHAIVATDVTTSGNTSAASIPLAIDTVLTAEPRAHGALAVLERRKCAVEISELLPIQVLVSS